jgi:alpha-galactosidase
MRDPRFMFEYEAGLRAIMDRLLARHDDLLIELCAEGGNRIDLATLKRGHTCWISDACEIREVARTLQCGANRFLPGNFANGALPLPAAHTQIGFPPRPADPERRADPTDADVVARMCGALQLGGDIARMSAATAARVRELTDRDLEIRPLLTQDYFPLTNQPQTPDDGEAALFVNDEKTRAVLLAFGGINTSEIAETAAVFLLKGLNAEAVYEVADLLEGGRRVARADGRTLMRDGARTTLRHGAALYALASV